MGIAIHHLAADGDLSPFLSLPAEVYRNDPHYSARPETAAVAGLRRPDFIDRQRIFVATDGDKARTRVVARLSPSLTNAAGKPYGMLGFFEAHNDPATVEALFAEAADWLRAGGGGDVIGPMDGDTWHAYRLNIGPYE